MTGTQTTVLVFSKYRNRIERELDVVLVYISNSFDRVILLRTAVGFYFQLMRLTAHRVG